MFKSQAELTAVIRQALAEHPDWLGAAQEGVSDGIADAIKRANERAGKNHMAMLAALALADPSRMTADTKKVWNDAILSAVAPGGGCEIERKFLKRQGDV